MRSLSCRRSPVSIHRSHSMFIHYSRTYQSSVTGSKLCRVVCAKCSCEFFYELFRVGMGEATSHYGLNSGGAQRTSADNASHELLELLKYCHDPVPCPSCGYMQKNMRWQVAITRARKWLVNAIAVVVFAAIALGITLIALRTPALVLQCYLGLVVATLLWVARSYVVMRRYDEGSFNRIPASDVNLLAPPALVIGEVREESVDLIPANPIKPRYQGAKLIDQLVHIALPPFCLRCLAETDNTYKPPFAVTTEQPFLPCCDSCARLLRRRSMLAALTMLLGQALLVWYLAHWGGMDEFGLWAVTIVYSLIPGLIVSIVFASILGAVARMEYVDSSRGWASLRTTAEIAPQLVSYLSLPQVRSVRCGTDELDRLRNESVS